MADYKDESLEEEDAKDVLNRTKQFVNAINLLYFPDLPGILDDES